MTERSQSGDRFKRLEMVQLAFDSTLNKQETSKY